MPESALLQPVSPDDESGAGYLEPSTARFIRCGATLHLTIAGEVSWLHISVVRLFPLSAPYEYFCVYDSDDIELGIIRTLAEFDAESRSVVTSDLHRRYFLPIVRRVFAVRRKAGALEWQVDTDRGPRTFTTRNLRENVVQPSPNRFLINDVDGNRYEVRDVGALDSSSRGYISRYL